MALCTSAYLAPDTIYHTGNTQVSTLSRTNFKAGFLDNGQTKRRATRLWEDRGAIFPKPPILLCVPPMLRRKSALKIAPGGVTSLYHSTIISTTTAVVVRYGTWYSRSGYQYHMIRVLTALQQLVPGTVVGGPILLCIVTDAYKYNADIQGTPLIRYIQRVIPPLRRPQ